MNRLYLEDVEVGQRFVTGSITITTEEIIAFAKKFDPQPFHLDADAAKETLFGGLAASGWHTASVTMRLMVDGGPQMVGGGIGASGELSWPMPTRPGDTLHVEAVIEEIKPSRSKPDRGMMKVRIETLNQDDEIVQLFVVQMLGFRRP